MAWLQQPQPRARRSCWDTSCSLASLPPGVRTAVTLTFPRKVTTTAPVDEVPFPHRRLNRVSNDDDYEQLRKNAAQQPTNCSWNRRTWFGSGIRTAVAVAGFLGTAVATTTTTMPQPALALVRGVAPPPPKGGGTSSATDRPKCTNVDECQALADQRRAQEEREAATSAQAVSTTSRGTRYFDLQIQGDGDGGDGTSAVVVRDGDEVQLFYKVLKLGKRSYDGLSGEGTVVFSRGYGLEDDESEAGQKSFTTTVGSYSNIAALNDAVVGMKVGGIRRFAVLPQQGWRKPGRACDGGPGGSGTGGDVKTDYVVVPTAQLVAEEACFDSTKQPFPTSYAQQRRMAQRFDQSLIMEVQVVSAKPSTSAF